jgi:uncharacterized protein
MAVPAVLQPLARSQRIGAIDVLRGYALLGVVVVNTQAFAGPAPPPATIDRVAAWIVACLFTAKSYSLFSLLFGLGFAIQMERAETRGQPFDAFFLRRCLILFLFGVAHAALLFEGDILTLYAILGVVLLRFRGSAPDTLVRWAVALLALAVLLNLVGAVGSLSSPDAGQGATPVGPAGAEIPAYRTPSYADDVLARLEPATTQAVAQLLIGFPNVFSMFLLGLYLGRRRAFVDLDAHLPLFRALCLWGLLLGLPLNAVSATLTTQTASLPGAWAGGAAVWLGEAVQAVGAPLLMLGYLGSIVLLVRRGGVVSGLLGRLAPMGQLSLTCYLSSSLLLNLVFYGFGLGLYERTGAALDFLIAVAVYFALLLFSSVYAPRFRYGPAEWLWRSLTYGRRQPLRLAPGSRPA